MRYSAVAPSLALAAALACSSAEPRIAVRGEPTRLSVGPSFTTRLHAVIRAGTAQAQEPYRWSGRVAQGQSIEIKGVNGEIEFLPASGPDVEVSAVKRGRRSDPAEVDIQMIEHGDGVTICAVYPTPEGREPNECRPGSQGRMNTRRNDVRVSFSVRVPAGVRAVGRTVNGEVRVGALDSEVTVRTVNGSVDIERARIARANTVNGSITATLTQAGWPGPLEFETVNGSIRLTLPPETGATLTASTVNGSIETDFPLTVTGRFSPRQVRGTIGNGGPELRVETVNGRIRLLRSS